ncbi:MAG: DUF3578 domain-containing protein [Polynucleobacter sp.]|nr:DUF3578 domain-containing protein [Polynucleobacter sp.]
MQERGKLIRTDLANQLRHRLSVIRSAFDPIFDDLAVEASDGIGRKTEAPWVRIFSKAMSPNPREGYYFVIHFSADGTAIFFTVGCGSTVWSGGDLRAIPDKELEIRTSWAKTVVLQRFKTLEPFTDNILLGARAPLPKTFEKATAFARRIDRCEIGTVDIDGLLLSAAQRLGEIYLSQLDQRDVSQGDQDYDQIVAISKPLRQSRRQGIGLSASERKAVEMQAMYSAIVYLEGEGYECRDTSASESFDILASKAGKVIKVEVKGTTSDICDSIMMTRNEFDLHRNDKGNTGLLIVSKIKLVMHETGPMASGGEVEDLLKWDINEWAANPIAFQLLRNR